MKTLRVIQFLLTFDLVSKYYLICQRSGIEFSTVDIYEHLVMEGANYSKLPQDLMEISSYMTELEIFAMRDGT